MSNRKGRAPLCRTAEQKAWMSVTGPSRDDSSDADEEETVTDMIRPTTVATTKCEPRVNVDLGLLKFRDNAMHVGRRKVTFANRPIYETALCHFLKSVPGTEHMIDDVDSYELLAQDQVKFKTSLKRVKQLLTQHNDYDDEAGTLDLGDKYTYVNPVPAQRNRRRRATPAIKTVNVEQHRDADSQ